MEKREELKVLKFPPFHKKGAHTLQHCNNPPLNMSLKAFYFEQFEGRIFVRSYTMCSKGKKFGPSGGKNTVFYNKVWVFTKNISLGLQTRGFTGYIVWKKRGA